MSVPTSNILNIYTEPKAAQKVMQNQSRWRGISTTFAHHLSQEKQGTYQKQGNAEQIMSKPTVFGKENIVVDKPLLERSHTTLNKNIFPNNFAQQINQSGSNNANVGTGIELKRGASEHEQEVRFKVSNEIIGTEKANIARRNVYTKARIDYERTNSIGMLGQEMQGGSTLLDMARNSVSLRNLQTVFGGLSLNKPDFSAALAAKTKTAPQNDNADTKAAKASKNELPLGSLSARFESGKDGISSIGYDRNGGTSYGKYQIASRVGSMDKFLTTLDTSAPDIAERLREAGPANTGSRRGGMPNEWKEIAKEQPERFEKLQEQFIYDNYYKPALTQITEKTSLKEGNISPAMEEVIWSTAIQHGPVAAARIFARAEKTVGGAAQDNSYQAKMIDNIYDIRTRQFGSSTEQVRRAVHNRLDQEKLLALDMLNGKNIQLA